MEIAILGAGLAGLGVASALLDISYAQVKIDLFDPNPIGAGTSGLSSGLLHAFAGKQARKSWHADPAMEATHHLLTLASHTIGSSCILSNGIIRPAVTDEQCFDFKHAADKHDECEWLDATLAQEKVAGLQCQGALYIRDGLTFDIPTYLQALFQACARRGTHFMQKRVTSFEKLKHYDAIIVATGYETTRLLDLPLHPVKGQLLELAWPTNIPPLPCSLISGGYLTMRPNNKSVLAGATFERSFTTTTPDKATALKLILSKVTPFFPSLKEAQCLNVFSGIRASASKNHLPIVGQVGEKHFVFTGLGSKGLLYHAYLGRCLAKAILDGQPEAIFEPVSVAYHLS